MKLSWEFYSARKKTTLPEFLSKVQTLAEALILFDSLEVVPPCDLADFFKKNKSAKQEEKEAKLEKKPRSTRSSRSKKRVSKKSDTEKKTDKEYFRKVIKKEK